MTDAKKIYLAVAGGLVAAGIVLATIGFVSSGYDPTVFSTEVDSREGSVVLGGVEVDDPESIPLIGALAEVGETGMRGF